MSSEREAEIAYRLPGKDAVYVNICDRCTLACRFCPKFSDWMMGDHYLKLGAGLPSPEEVSDAARLAVRRRAVTLRDVREARDTGNRATFADLASVGEVVFVGLGEPTRRMGVLLDTALLLRRAGAVRLRLNTDGLSSLRESRDTVPELARLIEAVSVSVNAPDAISYLRWCPNRYGVAAWTAACDFVRRANGAFDEVQATIVGLPGIDVDASRRLVEEQLGATFKLRPAFEEA